MKKTIFQIGVLAAAGFAAHSAVAETVQVSSTAHWTVMNRGQPTTMTNGMTGSAGMLAHANVVTAEGEHTSQWCRGSNLSNAEDQPVASAGYCSAINTDGDILWLWYMSEGQGSGTTWGVIGGTGAFKGATGEGKSSGPMNMTADGMAWISKSTGTITTK